MRYSMASGQPENKLGATPWTHSRRPQTCCTAKARAWELRFTPRTFRRSTQRPHCMNKVLLRPARGISMGFKNWDCLTQNYTVCIIFLERKNCATKWNFRLLLSRTKTITLQVGEGKNCLDFLQLSIHTLVPNWFPFLVPSLFGFMCRLQTFTAEVESQTCS